MVRLKTIVGLGLLASRTVGDQIGPTYVELDQDDVEASMACLQENYCYRYAIPKRSNIRCRVGNAMAYVCNYNHGGPGATYRDDAAVGCDLDAMNRAAELIAAHGRQIAFDRWRGGRFMSGWRFERGAERTYGFDRPCPDGQVECHTQCGNNITPHSVRNIVFWDFDMACSRTDERGVFDCQMRSVFSHWERGKYIAWPWLNTSHLWPNNKPSQDTVGPGYHKSDNPIPFDYGKPSPFDKHKSRDDADLFDSNLSPPMGSPGNGPHWRRRRWLNNSEFS